MAGGGAKAYAELKTITGQDGGTGASPIPPIRKAGPPGE
jgi:Glutamate synthase domain 2